LLLSAASDAAHHCVAAEVESWWTGKDSNLRSPQGAADLQSAGFSHSPTRPRKLLTPTASQSEANFAVFWSSA
jgi:hypothetical protein